MFSKPSGVCVRGRKVRGELIDGQYEELLRLAGSVKRGWIVPLS